ncbi:MAG TPA: hypothetical protein VGP88_07280, partial [Thermoplasmata archaeon]|nr:hypothetical protein [Thermoplasmata archaeon]
MAAARTRTWRAPNFVGPILGSSLPIWVALLVVLPGGISHAAPLTGTTSGHAIPGATVAGTPTRVLQSTADLTCDASRLLGEACPS